MCVCVCDSDANSRQAAEELLDSEQPSRAKAQSPARCSVRRQANHYYIAGWPAWGCGRPTFPTFPSCVLGASGTNLRPASEARTHLLCSDTQRSPDIHRKTPRPPLPPHPVGPTGGCTPAPFACLDSFVCRLLLLLLLPIHSLADRVIVRRSLGFNRGSEESIAPGRRISRIESIEWPPPQAQTCLLKTKTSNRRASGN